ncbi:MAG: AsmA family protein [Rhodanobacteraceae bacterium]|nr:MAG: AsmA family protein [Rhodanobacteraceae bacterium]
MPLPAPWLQHRLRWAALAAGVVVLALLATLAFHVNALLQPQRFTSLLESDLAAAGVKLELNAPARPQLFPRPGVRLQGFSLANAGAATPILEASGATIVVPWRALLHGDVAIERVEIEAPRIDLGELKDLLARLPDHRGPPRLPTILAGIHLSQGTLTNAGRPLLFEVSLDTGELVPGHPFALHATARTANGTLLRGSLDTVPSVPHAGTIDFAPTRIALNRQGGLALRLEGAGHWRGGEDFALELRGSLRHVAARASPAAAASPAASGSSGTPAAATLDQVVLSVKPARRRVRLAITLQISGADVHADFQLQPTEFGSWWQRLLAASPAQPPGPLPIHGHASVQHLELGEFRATGLSIDADADLAPAPAASVAPAAAASTAH